MTLREQISNMIEEAGLAIDDSSGDSNVLDSMFVELQRANYLLDRNKDSLLLDLLNIASTADAIRAAASYTRDFLLDLSLSLTSVQEVASELILLANKYKVNPPKAWIDISKGDFILTKYIPDEVIDEDEVEERSLSQSI